EFAFRCTPLLVGLEVRFSTVFDVCSNACCGFAQTRLVVRELAPDCRISCADVREPFGEIAARRLHRRPWRRRAGRREPGDGASYDAGYAQTTNVRTSNPAEGTDPLTPYCHAFPSGNEYVTMSVPGPG